MTTDKKYNQRRRDACVEIALDIFPDDEIIITGAGFWIEVDPGTIYAAMRDAYDAGFNDA